MNEREPTEQQKEYLALQSSIRAFLDRTKNASPEELRKLRIVIDGLKRERGTQKVEKKETVPPGTIEHYIAQWNRGEIYDGGKAFGNAVWVVRTSDRRIFILPDPKERNRYAGGNIPYYYDVNQDVKLNELRLTKAAEYLPGESQKISDEEFEDYFFKRYSGVIVRPNFTKGTIV